MEQYKPNLGELAGADARRDAVHIAVAPVVASCLLEPGDNVGIWNVSREAFWAEAHGDNAIGIVDPFLTSPVRKGQRFWLFLYPNSITNLRHVWEHPAFKAKLPDVRPVYPVTEES